MKMRILVLLLFCCGIGGRSYAGVVYTIDVFGKNLAIPQPEGLGINLDHSENFLKGKVPFGTKNQYDIDIVRFTDIAAEKAGSEYCIGITAGRIEYTDSKVAEFIAKSNTYYNKGFTVMVQILVCSDLAARGINMDIDDYRERECQPKLEKVLSYCIECSGTKSGSKKTVFYTEVNSCAIINYRLIKLCFWRLSEGSELESEGRSQKLEEDAVKYMNELLRVNSDSGSQDMGGIRDYIAEMKSKSSKYARFLTGDFDIFVNSHNAAKANFSVQYPKDFYKDETISDGYKLVRFTKLPAAQENDYWLSISVGDGLDILKYKYWTEQVKALCLENCHYRQPDSFFLEGDAGRVVSREKISINRRPADIILTKRKAVIDNRECNLETRILNVFFGNKVITVQLYHVLEDKQQDSDADREKMEYYMLQRFMAESIVVTKE